MTNTTAANPFSRSRLPLYAQLASLLRQRIKSGEWVAGHKLPTLEALEAEYGVARVTARQAVGLLEEEGLIWRKQGKGTFVARAVADHAWLRLGTQWDSLMHMIEGTTMRVVSMGQVEVPLRMTPQDGRPASGYQHIRRVHAKDAAPYCVIDLYVAQAVYDRAPRKFQSQLALRVLADMPGLAIGSAHQSLTIGSADMSTATLLEVAVSAPVAEVRRVITDQHQMVIYFAEIVYRGDFVKLDIDLLNGRATKKAGG